MNQYTIAQQLALSAGQYGSNTALHFPAEGLKITFSQLLEKADEVSKALLYHGYTKGNHIAIWSINCSRWVYTALGAAQIGVVFVPMNIGYKKSEIADICRRADINGLFAMDSFKEIPCADYLSRLFVGDDIDHVEFPYLREVYSFADVHSAPIMGWKDFVAGAETVSDEALTAAKSAVTNQDIYMMQFTSGTTARPKGALLTQYGCMNTGDCYARLLHMQPNDITAVPLPLFHCFGNVLTLLGGIISGSCNMYPPAFSASGMLELLEKEHVTCFMGVPTMYSAMMCNESFDAGKLSVSKGGVGGSCCPAPLMDSISEKFNMNHLVVGYGLSEAASLCTLSDIYASADERIYSVGAPLPGLEVSLYSPGRNVIDSSLERGEVVVRGFSVMKEYYKDPVETAKALDEDGWLHTGDVGSFHENGCLHIVGRLKDIIIRGGENISPSEIEDLALTMPGVAECQCVGVPDEVQGEEIAAFIVTKPDCTVNADDFRAFIGNHLAKYKIPKYVFQIKAMPLNSAGKVLKTELRQMAKEQLV